MKTGDSIFYMQSGNFRTGTFMTIIPKSERKDAHYIIVLDSSRNAKRVAAVYSCDRSSSRILFGEEVMTKPQTHMEVKPTPNNKPEATNAFVTTDNKLHLTKKEADAHQLELDFREWGAGRVHESLHCGRSKLLNFLVGNKTDIMKFMKRIK